jgi:predicted AlkP superfamily pyrophosphatase or phosphodiesterase
MAAATNGRRLTTLVASGGAAVMFAGIAVASAEPLPEQPAQHVIMFDIDGFDPRFLDGEYDDLAELPNIRALVEQGAHTVANGSLTSYSNSSRATTATGTYPDVHRNTGYYLDQTAGQAVTQERYIEPGVETIAESLGRQGRTGAYLQWYIVENYGASYGDPDALYTQPGGPCEERADHAVAILRGEAVDSGGTLVETDGIPDLMVIYCSEVDSLIHSTGFADPSLPELLQHTDEQVGKVVQAAEEAGILDQTAFIFTSDHGMREWTVPLLPDVLAALETTGFSVEVVPSAGGVPDPASEIVIVAAPRTADITLYGEAARTSNARHIAKLIRDIPGIASVYDNNRLRQLRASDKLGDLVVEPIEPYHLSTLTDGNLRGSHGGLAEAEVPLILAGAGIRPGAGMPNVGLVDVAAIVSALLGVEPPAASEGRVPPRLLR